MNTKLLLIIGPTAVGKSSLIDRALQDFPQLVDIITYTTRPMRAGEYEGHPYHFISEDEFKTRVAQNFFVEWAIVHGKLYGTSRAQIEVASAQGQVAVLDTDVQGAKVMLREFPGAVSVFLLPPSMDALSQRFRKRGFTDPADLERRLASAKVEMAQASHFHHQLINDDFESTYLGLRKIIEKLVKNQ